MGPARLTPRACGGGAILRRAWIGVALLSASWLFGLDYYHDADWIVAAALVVVGTSLLTGIEIRRPALRYLALTAALTIPAIVVAPWPHRAAFVLIFLGALLGAAPIPRRWPQRLGTAGIVAGTIGLVQALGMLVYEGTTARSHELPRILAHVVYAVTRLIGIDAALNGTTVALHSMRRTHYLGATWELLLAPSTWCFLLGGVTLLCLCVSGRRAAGLGKSAAVLLALIALWLPARAGILIAVFMHRALRTAYDAPLDLMNQFWDPWVHLALLSVPVLLALRFVRLPSGTRPKGSAQTPRRLMAVGMAVMAVFLITVAMRWDPPGKRQGGRILVDEHHSTWERTDRPYDTNWYGHESGYNYACIYDYCWRFYEMGRLTVPIDANALSACDVLMIKVPTSRYGEDEIAEVERFVDSGGGLLLVGEHTNVFNTGTYLNDIARRFGLRFRYDCLFDIDTVFTQLYEPPLVPHPIVQYLPPMDFAVSCSIDPGTKIGRAAIRATGLRSLPADYHASNYYPQVEDRAEARYGAFIQLWTMRHGDGRVAAFADSTIFSNFSTFEPGKAELMLGMLEWLNRRAVRWDARPALVALGTALTVCVWVLRRKWTGSWLVVLAAGVFGWALAVVSVQAMHRTGMPARQPLRPFTHVVIDRTVCDVPLSKSGFIGGREDGFGLFERWILRLGWFTSRRQGNDAFRGRLLVFMYPNQPVSHEFREALKQYVASGGHALVLDSAENRDSTANALLYEFGLSVDHAAPTRGSLTVPPGWPAVTVDAACEVKGATPLMSIGGTPVAGTVRHGQGTVTVIGFGSRFADANMGVTGDVIPDQQLREVYELQFSLLRSILSPSPRRAD